MLPCLAVGLLFGCAMAQPLDPAPDRVVLENDRTEAELLRRADEALDEVCARTGVDPERYPRPA